jgi:hypothetical protein
MDAYPIVILIHIIVGFLLVYFAAKAFKKTKYLPMLYLTFGFLLITVGDTIMGDLLGFVDTSFADDTNREMVEEVFEIFGFVLVLFAILKS